MSLYEIGLFSAFFNLFVNYIIGKPGSEFSPYEIFSSYTVWLSKWRLKRLNLYNEYEKQFGFEHAKYEYQLMEKKNDAARIIYNAAEPFFTWERAVGMCSICTGFWVSLIIGLIFTFNISEIIEIIVLSHVTTRLLNKFL